MKRPDVTEADTNEFAGMETIGEILAYVFARKGGEPSLRELLEMPDPLCRETLQKAATEIAEAGMTKCAAIVREYSLKAPPDERRYQCPYPPDDHPRVVYAGQDGRIFPARNAKAWIAGQKQRYRDYDNRKVTYIEPKN
jgi:hypothetical protein